MNSGESGPGNQPDLFFFPPLIGNVLCGRLEFDEGGAKSELADVVYNRRAKGE